MVNGMPAMTADERRRPLTTKTTFDAVMTEAIISGRQLKDVCESDPDFPHIRELMRYVVRNPAARDIYHELLQVRALMSVEEMLEIADDGRNDFIEALDKRGEPLGAYKINGEAVARSKMRLETRRWLAENLMVEFGKTAGGDTNNTMIISNDELAMRMAQVLQGKAT